ncbi:hypothetical protein E2C01_007921 [Portunus trituberculatus]|uniref:Uncharacterized protein n=1 Tax=Portunus trituberculatus TaxID=210409 RepID=A0A5B7D0F2_PORTR|nr:hypothetical protein [Portunus trituberculatus]
MGVSGWRSAPSMRCGAASARRAWQAGALCFLPNPQESHIKIKYFMQPMVNAVFFPLQSTSLVPIQLMTQHQTTSSPLAAPGVPRSVSWAASNELEH